MTICYERIDRHPGKDGATNMLAAHAYGGFTWVMEMFCDAKRIRLVPIPQAKIKTVAAGKANASKELVLSRARAKWPQLSIKDDNEAHALWCLETYRKGLLE